CPDGVRAIRLTPMDAGKMLGRGLDDAELAMPAAVRGSRSAAARVTCGAICFSNSTHFPLMLYSELVNPVTLQPGRARLWTKPPPIASETFTSTIGMARVACTSGAIAEPGDHDRVRRECSHFHWVLADAVGFAASQAIVDLQVSADRPAQLLE